MRGGRAQEGWGAGGASADLALCWLSWALLGALGRSWASLGCSWASLGRLLASLGVSWRFLAALFFDFWWFGEGFGEDFKRFFE